MVRYLVGGLAVLALVVACNSPKYARYLSNKEFMKIEPGGVTAFDLEAARKPPPKSSETNDVEQAVKPRLVALGSRLLVMVAEDSTLDQQYIVPPSGEIEFPPIGIVTVEGLTPTELARKIEKQLESSYLRSATVVVQLAPESGGAGVVYVLGAVGRQGPISIPRRGRFTIFQAILSAGTSGFANLGAVEILRYGQDGRKYMTKVNVARIKKGNFEEDIPLLDGDWVLVREKLISF
ncbi:polysaccharide biosynthesis/export family protein [bacterium]|nr:polysaccharide biosynthesis/export family protein [bacterium]